jgi:uncharacterized protein YndB with AHSA1/START domain
MIKTILIAAAIIVAVPVAGVLAYAATKPDTFEVTRSAGIKAPPERIFAVLNDFHKWGDWSPYERKDPAMRRTFSGADTGRGAVYAWDGNSDVGKGRMEIADTAAPNRLTLKLDFEKPFESNCVVDFTLEPKGGETVVTWKMRGPSPYIVKVMHTIFDMDKMVVKDFETGLANLRAITET